MRAHLAEIAQLDACPRSDARAGPSDSTTRLRLGDDVAALIARQLRDEGRIERKASR